MQKNAGGDNARSGALATKQSSMNHYPLIELLTLTSDMLALMQHVVRGEEVEEKHYARVFGTKEGLVQQLQRLCAVVTEIRAMDPDAPDSTNSAMIFNGQDPELLRHYVLQMAAQFEKTA